MPTILVRIANVVWISLLVLLVLIACYVAIGRQFFPAISVYKQDLEKLISDETGFRVEIESLEGGWLWLDPVVTLRQLKLSANAEGETEFDPFLSLNHFRIHLSVLQSLRYQKLKFQLIEADDLQLKVQQLEDGRWCLPNVPVSESSDSSPVWPVLDYLQQPHLQITNGAIHTVSHRELETTLLIPQAQVSYDGEQLYLSGKAQRQGDDLPFMQFQAERYRYRGNEEADAKVYVEWSSADIFDQYLSAYQWQGIQLVDVNSEGRAWIAIDENRVTSAQGQLKVHSLQWRTKHGDIAPLENFNTGFYWQASEKTSSLALHDLSFDWGLNNWSRSDVLVAIDPEFLDIRGEFANLELISGLLVSSSLIPESVSSEVRGYDPRGNLRNWHFNMPINKTNGPLFEFESELDNVSAAAFGGAPQAEGIDGYLYLNDVDGEVRVDSARFSMAFPELYKSGWAFKKSELSVGWHVGESDVSVFSDGLRLYFEEDQFVYADFMTLLREDGVHEDYLTLKIAVHGIPATDVTRFVPDYKVDPGLYEWLDRALVSGTIMDGIYVGHGSIDDIEADNSFTSTMFFNTRNAGVNFNPEWPAIENLTSRIDVHNSAFNVEGEAMFQGMTLKGLIARKAEGEDRLSISSSATPSQRDIHYWLSESPISDPIKAIEEQLSLSGRYQVAVELDIPLSDGRETHFNISVGLENGYVRHKDSNLEFTNVEGQLSISSEKGVTGQGITLNFLSKPATLNILSRALHSGSMTSLALKSSMDMTTLADRFDLPDTFDISGTFNYLATLTFDPDMADPQLLLSSDLKGVAVDWPTPMGKKSEQPTPLNIGVVLREGGLGVRASWQDRGRIYLHDIGSDRFGGIVSLGTTPPRRRWENTGAGLQLRANFAQIHADSWIEYFENATWKNRSGTGAEIPFSSIEVETSLLEVFGQSFPQSLISVSQSEGRWRLDINSPALSGAVVLPVENKPLELDLSRLHLLMTDVEGVESSWNPNQIPSMNLRIKDVRLNSQQYGEWSARIEQSAEGAIFKDLQFAAAGSEFKGQLSWLVSKEGSQTSLLTGVIKGKDFSKLQEYLKKPVSIQSSQYSSEIGLVWDGAPNDFALKEVSGNIAVNFEKGTFVEAASATEAFKVFGILNTDAITRRLKLDFTDIYQRGLNYDLVEGNARIERGMLTLESPLAIQSPSSAYKFTGEADLEHETLDMNMVVILPLTQNLPLAALALGAPQVGGALWLIDKILGEPLSKLTSATYRITGKWDSPKVNLNNVFDRSSKKK